MDDASEAVVFQESGGFGAAARFASFNAIRLRWNGSLRLRTLVIATIATLIAVIAAGVYVQVSVSQDLYETRTRQVLLDSARASAVAQRLLDASDAQGRIEMNSLALAVRGVVRGASASQRIGIERLPNQPDSPDAPQDSFAEGLAAEQVTQELMDAVESSTRGQFWQPAEISSSSGEPGPGVVVGSRIVFPGSVGEYGLFIGYSYADVESTVATVGRVLLITGVVLLSVLLGLAWVLTRAVFRPIRVAADTSRQIAAGRLDVRMPAQQDAQFDALADSFNVMTERLRSRIDELAELSNMQQRFVSDVSHELRTPLTTIRLASEVMFGQREALPASGSRSAELLHSQVIRFERLLNDLLELSRYDAGSVPLECEEVQVVEVVSQCVEDLQSIAAQSQVTLVLQTSGQLRMIVADPRRVRRVVQNLLSNAVEYGRGSHVVASIAQNEWGVSVRVRDYGVGMTPEQVAQVFHRFWRADPSRKRTLGGSGLGLAIAREDAAIHGGSLTVWSEPGRGTAFVLSLPNRPGVPLPVPALVAEPGAAPGGAVPGESMGDAHA